MDKTKDINQKQKLYLTIISVMALLSLIISASYSFFASDTSATNSNVTVNLGSRPVFTAETSGTVSLNAEYVTTSTDTDYVIATNTGTVKVTLTTNYSESATCTFDVVWLWDETSTTKNQYTKSSGATKEYTALETGSNAFSEIQLNNYSVNSRKTVLYSGSITNSGNLTVEKTYTIKFNFYKTTVDQSAHRGASYSGKVMVENVVC